MAYELLSGELPFEGRTAAELLMAHAQARPVPLHERAPQVPEALSRVVMRLLEKRPADRYASALKVALGEAGAAAPEAEVRPPRAAPQQPRAIHARLRLPSGQQVAARCIPVSRTGLHVALSVPLPALRAFVEVVLDLRGTVVACRAQVVQHVTEAQARAWGVDPGVGVELLQPTPAFLGMLQQLQSAPEPGPPPRPAEGTAPAARPAGAVTPGRGSPAETPRRPLAAVMPTRGSPPGPFPRAAVATPPARGATPEVEAEVVLARFARTEDSYVLLGMPRDADLSRLTRAARTARRSLEELLERPLPELLRDRALRLLEQVSHAQHVLLHPERKAEYDAPLRNWRGVARCLEAGLSVSGLQRAQRRFHSEHPRRAAQATVQFHTARALERAGRLKDALAAYEEALALDPLDLVSHQQHHALTRRLEPARAVGGAVS